MKMLMMKRNWLSLLCVIVCLSFAAGMSTGAFAAKPTDNDGDGWKSNRDCNDNDPLINPDATEICSGGVDENCDDLIDCDDPTCSGDPACQVPQCTDNDGDGYGDPGDASCPNGGATDCDDNNTAVNPGATEGPYDDATCSDGWDNNCDGLIDGDDLSCQAPTCTDNDGDGYGDPGDASCPNGGATDCDDSNAAVNPGATEGPVGDATCSDTWDNNCDGLIDGNDLSCQLSDEVCNDGLDNNGNGDIDCADSACTGESACTAGNRLSATRVTRTVLGIGPDDGLWNATAATTYSMAWRDDINDDCAPDSNCSGNSPTLTVKAIHNGTDIAFLMSWNDVTQSSEVYQPSEFGDRAVIMLNANRICQMGSPNNPTNMWFWNAADKTQGQYGSVQNLLGGGIGTVTHTSHDGLQGGDDNIQVVSNYTGTGWQVVMSRPLAAIDPADQFAFTLGVTTEVAFALYDGKFKQRNGAKWISGRESMDITP